MKHWNKIMPASAMIAVAVAGAALADPQYNGVFVAHVGASDKDVSLERQERKLSKTSNLYSGSYSFSFGIDGERSPVRFPAGSDISLIVRTADPNADPVNLFDVTKMVAAKGTRSISSTGHNFIGTKSVAATAVPFEASPYKKAMTRLHPASPLGPGEYCASEKPSVTNGAAAMYCFGVD